MACFHPLRAYKLLTEKTDSGKAVIVFDRKSIGHKIFEQIDLPCGQCIGCRIDRSRQWAVRCVHEASLYNYNCFITLTFSEENLNEKNSLVKTDFQKFMKRLRKRYRGIDKIDEKYPIRYFHCGEYGSELLRPHHHACIFNFDFPDKVLWTIKENNRLYRSEELEDLWGLGYCLIGDVTFESAAYVARYVLKKVNGEKAAERYIRDIDKESGECFYVEPEYITMSRRPGIGNNWYKKFKKDLFPKDFLTIAGKKYKVPRYYDSIYDIEEPEKMANIKKLRKERALCKASDNTLERLKVKEYCLKRKTEKLIRSIEL